MVNDPSMIFGGFRGGIFNGTGTRGAVLLQNTIIARNDTRFGTSDCSGPVTSLGNNLIGDPSECTIPDRWPSSQLALQSSLSTLVNDPHNDSPPP
jgi:hypothetical protein